MNYENMYFYEFKTEQFNFLEKIRPTYKIYISDIN